MATEAKRREMILKGDLLKTILAICLPIALYNFFNSAYTVIDQIICASINTTAQNAVSSISQIKSTISAFGGGLAAGGGVLVARYYGAGDLKNARHSASNLLFMSVILSLILMLILIPLSEPILRMCQIAEDSVKIGVNYFRLQMLELAFVSINSVFIGLEKAKGNSKRIMVLNIVVMLMKLGLTCAFVYGFKWLDIVSVETATIIAQAALTLYGLIILFRPSNILHVSIKLLPLKKVYTVRILQLSIPIFFGKFVMSMGKVVVNGMCGAFWNKGNADPLMDGLIVGTLGVSNNISGLITSPTNSFEEGTSTIVSQNLGNRNIKRAIRTFWKSLIVVTIISAIGYVLLRFFLINQITDLFTLVKNQSESKERMETYKNMIKDIFVFDSLSIPALGITAAILGLLYGFGQTKLSFFLNLSRIGSRIIILLICYYLTPLKTDPTFCAGLSMGISNIVILIVATLFLVFFLLHVKKKGYLGMQLSDPEPDVSPLVYEEDEKKEEFDPEDTPPIEEKETFEEEIADSILESENPCDNNQ